jgi:hypothetical protein
MHGLTRSVAVLKFVNLTYPMSSCPSAVVAARRAVCCVSCVITRLVVALSAARDRQCRHGSGLMPMPQAPADNVSQSMTQSDNIAPATIPYFIPYFSISARHRSRKCHRRQRGPSSMAPLSTQSRFLLSRLCRDVCLPSVHLVTLTGS